MTNWEKIFEIQRDEHIIILTEKQAEKLVTSEDYFRIEYNDGDSDGIVELKHGEPQRFIVSDELAQFWAQQYCLEKYGAYEIAKNAYMAWNPYFCDGVLFYDFEEGDIVPIALMGNESVSEDWDATPIYKIRANDMQYIATAENLLNNFEYDFFGEYAENHSEDIESFLNSSFLKEKYKEIDDMSSYRDFGDAIIEFLAYHIWEQGL